MRTKPAEVEDAMKAAFRAFFDERAANVEWSGWETAEQPGRVLVDDVFDLDALVEAMRGACGQERELKLLRDIEALVVQRHKLREALDAARNFIEQIAGCTFPDSEVNGEVIGEAQDTLNAIDAAIAIETGTAIDREAGVVAKP